MNTNIITTSSINYQVSEICKSIIDSTKWNLEYLGNYNSLLGFVLKYDNKKVTYIYHTDIKHNLKSKIIDRMLERKMAKIICRLKKI